MLIWAALWALREIPTWQVNELLKPAGDGSARLVLDKEKAELFQVENEARRTLTQIILGVFGLLALGFLGVRSWANYKDSCTAEQGQITDSFNKAIELLGATHAIGAPILEIRLGAIYALERIARDSARDHWPVMEVLTAYVRANADWKEPKAKDVETAPDEEKKSEEKPKPRIDIQAILTVLGRRERSKAREGDNRLDLSNTDLRGASLSETHLEGANLWAAHLEGAYLGAAHLEEAHLGRAHLEGAHLWAAHLEEAHLMTVHLEGANLEAAHMSRLSFVNQDQINSANGNQQTELPDGIQYPPHWLEDSNDTPTQPANPLPEKEET